MTKTELHRLVDELPEDLVDGTAGLLRQVISRTIDPEQAWYWTAEWQAAEREADADLEAGRFQRFESDDAFLAHLENVPPPTSAG